MIINKNYLYEKIDKSCVGYFCFFCNMFLFCFGKKEYIFRFLVKIKKKKNCYFKGICLGVFFGVSLRLVLYL